MASRGLGTLTLDLVAKIAGFTGPLTKAERDLDARTKRMNKMAYDFGHSFGSAIRSAAGSFLAFAGVSVTIGGAVTAIKSAIDHADQLRDASIRLGVGTEILSKWGYAAKQTGADLEGLTKGLRILSRNATEALDPKSKQAGLFKALGIDKESLRDLETLVPKIADAFRGMADGPQKAAIAMELFGKSGADLVEFLNSGGAGLDEFGAKLERLGGVVTPQTAAAADEFNDKLGDLTQQFAGAGLVLAERLLPHLNDLIDLAGEAKDKTSGLGKVVSWLGDQADAAAKDFQFFKSTIKDISNLWTALNSAMSARGFLSSGNFKAAYEEIKKGQGALIGMQFNDVQSSVQSRQRIGRFSDPAYERASLNFNPNPGGRNAAVDAYLGGGSSGGSRGGKSKAQQDAERLQAAYERMNQSLTEQIALHGKTGETAKQRYDIENGELAKLSPALKQALLDKLDIRDAQEAETAAYEKSLEVAKKMADAENSAIQNAADLIEQMQFELSLIGLSNKEREKAITLRQLEAGATAEQRAAIADLIEQQQNALDVESKWADVKDVTKDFLMDMSKDAYGTFKNIGDYWESLVDRMISRWLDSQLDEWFSNIGKSGSGSGGSGGGFWASVGQWASSLFGGGKASGGWTLPNTLYEVNERGFEMATVGGRDFMLTGSRPVEITPNHKLGRGGVNFVANYRFDAPTTAKTQAQLSARTQRDLNLAQRDR